MHDQIDCNNSKVHNLRKINESSGAYQDVCICFVLYFLSLSFFLTMFLSVILCSLFLPLLFSSSLVNWMAPFYSFDKKKREYMPVMPNVIETTNIFSRSEIEKIASRHLCLKNYLCVLYRPCRWHLFSKYYIWCDSYLEWSHFTHMYTSSLMMIDCHLSFCCLDRLLTLYRASQQVSWLIFLNQYISCMIVIYLFLRKTGG